MKKLLICSLLLASLSIFNAAAAFDCHCGEVHYGETQTEEACQRLCNTLIDYL